MVQATLPLSSEATVRVRSDAKLAVATPVDINPQTAQLVLRIARPTPINGMIWAKDQVITGRVVVEVDGTRREWAEFQVSGGVTYEKPKGDFFENPRPVDYSTITWSLPHGFFNTEKVLPEDYAKLRAQRLGETAKSTYKAWVEIEHKEGLALNVKYDLSAVVAPADSGLVYHHSIAYENSASATELGGDGVITVSLTANSGTNRVVCVMGGNNGNTPGSTHTVTFGGASATITRPFFVTSGSCCQSTSVDIFNDSEVGSGAKTASVTATGGDSAGGTTVAAVCFSGVDQTTPAGTAQTGAGDSGAPSVTVTSVNSTDLVVDFWGIWSGTNAAGANQTERINTVASNSICISTQLGSDGGVMSWTHSGGSEWGGGAFALKEAAAGGDPEIALIRGGKLVGGGLLLKGGLRG